MFRITVFGISLTVRKLQNGINVLIFLVFIGTRDKVLTTLLHFVHNDQADSPHMFCQSISSINTEYTVLYCSVQNLVIKCD
jgi:hypothetical protein